MPNGAAQNQRKPRGNPRTTPAAGINLAADTIVRKRKHANHPLQQ